MFPKPFVLQTGRGIYQQTYWPLAFKLQMAPTLSSPTQPGFILAFALGYVWKCNGLRTSKHTCSHSPVQGQCTQEPVIMSFLGRSKDLIEFHNTEENCLNLKNAYVAHERICRGCLELLLVQHLSVSVIQLKMQLRLKWCSLNVNEPYCQDFSLFNLEIVNLNL